MQINIYMRFSAITHAACLPACLPVCLPACNPALLPGCSSIDPCYNVPKKGEEEAESDTSVKPSTLLAAAEELVTVATAALRASH